jgi:hypothetical protein
LWSGRRRQGGVSPCRRRPPPARVDGAEADLRTRGRLTDAVGAARPPSQQLAVGMIEAVDRTPLVLVDLPVDGFVVLEQEE